MIKALWVAKTGLDAQQMRMSVISNNLANVSTNGYKRGRAAFGDLLYQTIRQPGAQSSQNTELPSGLMLGTGVRTIATVKNFSQGNILQTNSSLDVAIRGKGFFQILLPDGGTAYTRDGAFQRNSQGQMVTASGYILQPAITIPSDAEKLTIAVDGTISVLISGDTNSTQIGTAQLANFVNPAGLQPVGDNLFKETAASGTAQVGTPGLSGLGQLEQGALESSNVNAIEELVNLIETNRAYEMNSKAIDTGNKMAQFVTNNL